MSFGKNYVVFLRNCVCQRSWYEVCDILNRYIITGERLEFETGMYQLVTDCGILNRNVLTGDRLWYFQQECINW